MQQMMGLVRLPIVNENIEQLDGMVTAVFCLGERVWLKKL